MSRTTTGRGLVRRHKVLTALLASFVLMVGVTAWWAAHLNEQIANIPRIDLDIDETDRPERPTGASADAVNILLAGVDADGGPALTRSIRDGAWQPGSHRSDTIMVLHITADRKKAYVVSVPRDSWVYVEGHGMSKINAALSYGGPPLFVRTLEQFTGLRMDHLAIADWEGFRDLTTAVGGVEVYVPRTITNTRSGKVWEQGTHTLAGEEALKYVRHRYGLPHGDFDRIRRQQNFMRATMEKLFSRGALSNPVAVTGALKAVTSHLVVDEGFTDGGIRDLAFSMWGMRRSDITFLTVPVVGTGRVDGQSVVLVEKKETAALFDAVADDDLERYLERYGRDDVLGGKQSVS